MEINKDNTSKPCLYSFPENDPLYIYDMDELHDENFVILCIERDEMKTVYIWKGQNFEAGV